MSTTTASTTATPSLRRAGVRSGVIAAAATTAVAGAAHAVGVSLKDNAGKAFPLYFFPLFTLFFTGIGVLIALGMRRWNSRPRTTFVRTTLVLTALSFIPDIKLDADTGTKLALACTHLVAAATIIPMLAACLSD